jgi:hypothetical protein
MLDCCTVAHAVGVETHPRIARSRLAHRAAPGKLESAMVMELLRRIQPQKRACHPVLSGDANKRISPKQFIFGDPWLDKYREST